MATRFEKLVESLTVPGWRSTIASPETQADIDETPIDVPLPYLPKQVEFIESPKRYTAYVGGVGSGKSYGLCGWVIHKMYQERGSGTYGGIFANTYKQLSQATLVSLWEQLENLGFQQGRDFVYNEAPPRSWAKFRTAFLKDHNGVLSVRWWGQAVTRSLENVNATRGLTLGWAAIDEARDLKKDAYEIVLARLRCTKARLTQLKLATTPNGFDWIYKRFVESADPDSVMVHGATRENTFLPPEFEESLRRNYDDLFAQQEIDAKFVLLARGAVYRSFDRNVHVDAKLAPVAGDWVVSYDFNRTPYSVVMGQVVGEQLRVLDELYMLDADTASANEEAIRRLKAGYLSQGANVYVYGDPAGNQMSTKNNFSDYDIITRDYAAAFGARFVPSWGYTPYPVVESVHAVNGLMRNSLGDTSRFRVHPRCRHLIEDLERVHWKPGTAKINKDGDENKMLTHLSDALRYLVAERFPLLGSGVGGITV